MGFDSNSDRNSHCAPVEGKQDLKARIMKGKKILPDCTPRQFDQPTEVLKAVKAAGMGAVRYQVVNGRGSAYIPTQQSE